MECGDEVDDTSEEGEFGCANGRNTVGKGESDSASHARLTRRAEGRSDRVGGEVQ